MRNAGLDEAQAGTKIAERNINNLTYADDTTLLAESDTPIQEYFFLDHCLPRIQLQLLHLLSFLRDFVLIESSLR